MPSSTPPSTPESPEIAALKQQVADLQNQLTERGNQLQQKEEEISKLTADFKDAKHHIGCLQIELAHSQKCVPPRLDMDPPQQDHFRGGVETLTPAADAQKCEEKGDRIKALAKFEASVHHAITHHLEDIGYFCEYIAQDIGAVVENVINCMAPSLKEKHAEPSTNLDKTKQDQAQDAEAILDAVVENIGVYPKLLPQEFAAENLDLVVNKIVERLTSVQEEKHEETISAILDALPKKQHLCDVLKDKIRFRKKYEPIGVGMGVDYIESN